MYLITAKLLWPSNTTRFLITGLNKFGVSTINRHCLKACNSVLCLILVTVYITFVNIPLNYEIMLYTFYYSLMSKRMNISPHRIILYRSVETA